MEILPTTTHRTIGSATPAKLYFYPAPRHTTHWPIRRRHWHPRITVYRVLVTGLTIGLGTAKAITSTSAGGTSCSVTIEWISGIIILLLSFFLSRYETHDDPKPHWLFRYDLLGGIRALVLRPYSYEGEEQRSEPLPRIRGPMVTRYRMLVSVSALSFGVIKATLSYLGYKTAPTVVEWVFGVVITVSLYWLGMYENSPTAVIPWLFVRDCSNQVFVYFLCVVHLAALFATHYWTVSRFSHAQQEFHKHWETQNTTYLSSLDRFINKASVVSPIGAGIGTGVAGTCAILGSLGWLLTPGLVQLCHAGLRLMQSLSRRSWSARLRRPSCLHGLSLPPWLATLPGWLSLSPSTWIKLFSAVSVIVGATVYLHLYGIGRIGFIVASAWALPWLCALLAMPWPENPSDIPSAVAFHLGFTLFWTKIVWVVILACVAVPLAAVAWCMTSVCPAPRGSHRLMSYRDSEILRQRRQRLDEETERLLSP